MAERKSILLRLDPAVHDALARWAADELRSTNAQIEFLLRAALAQAGRLPGSLGPVRRRGRGRRPLAEDRDEEGADGPDGPTGEPRPTIASRADTGRCRPGGADG